MTDVMKRQSEHDIDVQAITGENTGGTPVAATGGGGGGMYDVHSGENVPLVSVPGNNIGVGQDLSDGINKKARYVSDGQIPNMQNYMAQGGVGGGMQNAALYSAGGMPGVGGMTLQQQQQQQQQQHLQPPLSGLHPNFGSPNATLGGRSFSGTLGMGGLPSPASPYLNEQYAAAALSSPALGNPQSASFMGGQSPLSAQTMFNPSAYGPNHVAMAAAAAAAAGGPAGFLAPPNMALLQPHPQQNATGRTVYVGNLPEEASVDELLSQVKFGPIENVRLLPEKNCAFISFLDGNMAAAFHADASVKKMSLHNQELKIGWGKPSACPTPIMVAVQQNQATRNVYLGQLDEDTTEQSLYDELSKFGPIDQVKIVRDKNIGFVHFLSISTAMKVVSSLPNEPAWTGKRVNYGKDRCAYVPKSQQQNQAHNSQAAAMGMAAAASLGYPTGYNPAAAAAAAAVMGGGGVGGGGGGGGGYSNIPSPGAQVNSDDGRSPAAVASVFAPMANSTGLQQMGNRTVYLGNIHPDTTTEEICNHIRGGILQNIRFIPEKHIAFITFIESNAALAFYHLASYSGIMIHQRRLKIGWGKHSGPLSPAIAMAVQAGGSRNVYIGNIEDFELHTVDKLRSDFGEYGETELVNTFKEKNCAFVNFCNIQNAIKAIEAMKNHQDYPNQRIGAGKDRCGNPPRAVANTMNIGRSGSHSPNPALHTSMDEGLSPPSMETDQSTTDFTALTPPGRSGDHTGDTSVGTIPVVSEDV